MRSFNCLLLVALVYAPPTSAAPAPTYAEVAPILQKHCVVCHRGASAPRGLQLDTYNNVLKGSARGPVAVPGSPASSELVRRLRGQSLPRMPLTGPPYLSEDEIVLIERWIAGGMATGRAPATPPPAKPATTGVIYADVEPIFLQRCVKCHTDGGLMGAAPEGLRLKTREQILSGSERVVVVPGAAGASELVRRIRGQARPRMPFDGPPFLSAAEIRLIADWVDQGARDAQGDKAPVPAGRQVRLHGTLTARWALDGFALQTGAGTRIDKAPAAGDYVEVRGVVRADGSIQATRIRRR